MPSQSQPAAYAVGTSVPVEKSKAEIERMLARAGAPVFGTHSDTERGVAVVFFNMLPKPGSGEVRRAIRIELPLPKLAAMPFPRTRKGKTREAQLEQACRERWRLLCLAIKAKLELIAAGASTAEREFFADIQLPDARTLHAAFAPHIAQAYKLGVTPSFLALAQNATPPPGSVVEGEILEPT